MAKPTQHALDTYEATHWGIASQEHWVLQDANWPRGLPRQLVTMGQLLEIGVEGAQAYAIHFPRRNDIMLTFWRPQDSRPERLFNIMPKKYQTHTKRKYWTPGGPEYTLGEVARAAGGVQAETYRYPQIPVQVLGRATYVVYATHKKGDGPSDYIHEIGEVSGIQPYLCIDKQGRLWYAGGDYTVEDGGITN